jgi:O-antigen ligase
MQFDRTTKSGMDASSSAPAAAPQDLTSDPQTDSRSYWLGLPAFKWSLTLLGFCMFTFAIVTYYLPVGELGIVIGLVGLLLDRQKLRFPFPVWIYGAFVLWAFIASLASPYPEIALERVVDHLKLWVIMLVAVNALQTEGQVRFYLLFFLGCFILFPIRGTLVGGDERGGRVVWNYIYENSNDLATLSLIALGMAVGLVFAAPSRKLVRLGAGISTVLLVVVILLTQSRGALIGMLAGIGSGLIVMGLKQPLRVLLYGGILALVVGVTVPANVLVRMSDLTKATTIEEADREGSAAERFEILKIAMQMFKDNPVFGVGLGVYPRENARYNPEIGRMDTHNTYMNLAAEVGLPGVTLWCALVWSVLRYAYRRRKLAPPGELTTQQAWLERAFWGYLVAALVGTYVSLSFPYIVLAVLWCSATVLGAKAAENADKTSA